MINHSHYTLLLV